MNVFYGNSRVSLEAYRDWYEEKSDFDPGFGDFTTEVPVRIWSSQHGAYWGPGSSGYVGDRGAAGVYTLGAAYQETKHSGAEEGISFELARDIEGLILRLTGASGLKSVQHLSCGLTVLLDGEYPTRRQLVEKAAGEGLQVAETDWRPVALNAFRDLCHDQAVSMGWWENPRETGTTLMLIVSELAEAMEGDRKALKDDHLPHRAAIEVELADAMIRILDLAGRQGLDVGGALLEKLAYNRTRSDHQPEARAAAGGKRY